jgi:hypothetical protein
MSNWKKKFVNDFDARLEKETPHVETLEKATTKNGCLYGRKLPSPLALVPLSL